MIPGAEEMQRQLQQFGTAFRQMTGGLPATVYIERTGNGFRLAVRVPDGSPVSATQVVEALIQAVGVCCQQLGMTVKI